MNYKVIKTDNIEFNPTSLDIIVGEKFVKTIDEEVQEFINVDTVLTEKGEVSQTQRLTHHVFPYEVWQGIISGYDSEKKEPILDSVKLNGILKNFKLKLA